MSYIVPIELHGDDADAHRRRTFLVVSWQSAVTKGATIDCIFPAYCVDNNQATEETASQLDMALVWSLQQMSAGTLFEHDHWVSQQLHCFLEQLLALGGLAGLGQRATRPS